MVEAIPVTERRYILAEKHDETPEVLILKFMPEDGKPCPFEPGMFMMISGLDKEGNKYIGRAYSIASDPSTPGMEFMVIKAPKHGDHIGTSHFMNANVGDIFVLKGPNGQFRFDPATDKKVCFIAGGTGLAPFASMLRHIKVTNSHNDIALFYSIKYPTEIIWKDELSSYVNDLHVKMIITVTRPQSGDGWTGQTGHIDSDMIKTNVPDFLDRGFYICGPLEFVKAMKDALASLNVNPSKIKADVWG